MIHKPGANAFGEEIIASYLSADVPKVTRASGLEMKLKRLPSTVGETSADTKHALRVEIRKFGRSK